ncbi:hypothetical protein [Pseudonocardia phyllosphaerae]|uniref:hypothetical protein n=1 Tax=Pseudonocardia phyllosphaerae TaxID=3390502 RepID=UPI00397DDE65
MAGTVLLGSCGKPEVTASTTCTEFLGMDQQTQMTGVEQLAAQTDGEGFKGPMGIMNLIYDCQHAPHSTVGEVMEIS